jgi:hypothetical protein
LNAKDHAQLRFEAIDTLETHYQDTYQPLELAIGALEHLLESLGITDVAWNETRTKVTSANDGTEGYILSRAVEKNGRRWPSFTRARHPKRTVRRSSSTSTGCARA